MQTHHAKSVAHKCPLTAIWVCSQSDMFCRGVMPGCSNANSTHQNLKVAALHSPTLLEEPKKLLPQPNLPIGAEPHYSQLQGRTAPVVGAFCELQQQQKWVQGCQNVHFKEVRAIDRSVSLIAHRMLSQMACGPYTCGCFRLSWKQEYCEL